MITELEVRTRQKSEMVDITDAVRSAVRRSGLQEGSCLVWVPHTTAGLTVNENADPSVRRDILAALDRLVPERGDYRHSEGNSPGHIKSTFCGHGETLIVEGGGLVLGTWQGIFLVEFDGPRTRRVILTFMGRPAGGDCGPAPSKG